MNAQLLRAEGCNGAELRAFAQEGDRRRRLSKIVDGVLHFCCSSCKRYLPGTKENFYFQSDKRKGVEPRPHSWCKRCYNERTGRGVGCKRPPAVVVPMEIVEAQAGFLAIRSFSDVPLVGAAA